MLTRCYHAIMISPCVPIIEEIEKALSFGFMFGYQKTDSIDSNINRQKAPKVYNHLKQNEEYFVNPHILAS